MPRLIALVFGLVGIALPCAAVAKPTKLAICHLDGDSGNKIGQAVAAALDGKEYTVVGPVKVDKTVDKLGYSGDLDTKQMREVQDELGVTAMISGRVEKEGNRRTLHLKVVVHGKKSPVFTIQFKDPNSTALKNVLHDRVAKELSEAGDDDDKVADKKGKKKSKKDDDEDQPKKKRLTDADDEPKKKAKKDDDDEPKKKKLTDADDDKKRSKKDDDEPKKKAKKDDDEPKKKRIADAGDDDRPHKRKHRGDDDDDELSVRASAKASMMPALRVDLGAYYGQRHLDYTATMTKPPAVSTAAPAGMISGEVYPLALSDKKSPAAGLGLYGEYDKTAGLNIQVPGMATQLSVNQQHYAIGARYQYAIGTSAVFTAGFDYARRTYKIDRTAGTVNAPDVDYSSARPNVSVRVPATKEITVFAGAGALLVLSAGQISDGTQYGSASAYGFDLTGGLDYKVSDRISVRAAAVVDEISMSFKGTGTLAMTSGTTAASDRDIGVAASVGVKY
jgi:opacity protein-like surface antigen